MNCGHLIRPNAQNSITITITFFFLSIITPLINNV